MWPPKLVADEPAQISTLPLLIVAMDVADKPRSKGEFHLPVLLNVTLAGAGFGLGTGFGVGAGFGPGVGFGLGAGFGFGFGFGFGLELGLALISAEFLANAHN